MKHKEEALSLFDQKYHCSQAVLAAFAGECGVTKEQALKSAGCFGGGMRKGEVCGACTGALMVLGLMFGGTDPTDHEELNKLTDKMMEAFAAENGSYICNDLLGIDISKKEEAEKARESGLFREFCPKMVASAVDILEEIIKQKDI